jgi:hypothetical protein
MKPPLGKTSDRQLGLDGAATERMRSRKAASIRKDYLKSKSYQWSSDAKETYQPAKSFVANAPARG